MWMNSAYTNEIARMQTVNKLVNKGSLTDPSYKMIELIPVEIEQYYSVLLYAHEEKTVYEMSFNEAMAALYEHEKALAR